MSAGNRRPPLFLTAILALCLLAAACGPRTTVATLTPGPAATTAVPAPSTTPTVPPSAIPGEPTTTAIPAVSATPSTDLTPTAGPGGDAAATTDPAVATSTPIPAGPGTNLAEFVADVTVIDGTDFTPGEAFVKTWQLKNAGTATWTTSYRLVYVSGEHMGGPDSVPLPTDVPPGQTVDISVDLTAPAKLGPYTGFWMLSTPNGTLFGLGANGNQPVYVQIDTIVGGTPQPTAPAGTISLSAATLTVDEANRSGVCPQTFQFNLSFTSQGGGAVSYKLEASADTPGFVFNLPEPSNSIFNTVGPRTFSVTYNLQFTNAVSGQVWVHFTAPSELTTNKVSFSLACTP